MRDATVVITECLLAAVVLLLAGCRTNVRVVELTSPILEGGVATATIQYHLDACPSGNAQPGCYHYIVKVTTSAPLDPVTDGIGEPLDRSHCDYFTRVHLSFYNSKGFSLYLNRPGDNALAPGWNDTPDERNAVAGGWEWKGAFPEVQLSLSAFKEIATMKARLGKSGCQSQ